MKATKKKSKVSSKDKYEEYYDSLDLLTWWDEFSGDCNENGTLKYKSVWAFIIAKTKVDWQRKFLYWILGPKGESKEYTHKQFEWEEKRNSGRWYNTVKADAIKKEISNKQNALEAMKEIGKVNVTFIERLASLMMEIDNEYSGRLFLPELSVKENNLRVQTYTSMLDRCQSMLNTAQVMFGKTHGLDIENLSLFLQLFQKGQEAAAATMGFTTLEGETAKSPQSKTMDMLTQMLIKKSVEQNIALPSPDMEQAIIETMKPQLVGKAK